MQCYDQLLSVTIYMSPSSENNPAGNTACIGGDMWGYMALAGGGNE